MMTRSDAAWEILDDDALALEEQEEHDRAQEWAGMSEKEREDALRADRPTAEGAQEAARREGLIG